MKSLFSKDPKQELEVVMTCLMFICFCCLLISFIQNAMLCFDLGKDNTDDFLWIMLPQSVTLLAMAVCSILIFCLLRNVKRKEVFTKENSTLIVAIGGIVELNGLLQGFFGTLVSVSNLRQTYLIYILLGVFILFIGCVFKVGVCMKEEQELTI
ncbi:DUF2975 domain-containing protein [Bacteroides nordii]|uniref:DUF2975 domain-containing protein n=1 Tax=Bacteroides nordii TaxID=291645 RepID=UPI00241F5BA0|nr:DUF2975 domain-containing protein [Bacteroides nordii]MBD9109972.1 DUF2975 domain-containing protein [Bacteroides nordii]